MISPILNKILDSIGSQCKDESKGVDGENLGAFFYDSGKTILNLLEFI